MNVKRIATIQDISCVGKCSLTVALPIISAMGVEAAIVPTAVLSTHTAFSGFTFCDLTEEIPKIADHWKKEKLSFDAIYTGYLGSFRQIELVGTFFENNPGALRFVDPAMGDNGKLYTGFDEAFAKNMASLCAKADVIVPNLTEASFMLGIPYKESYSEAELKEILEKLCALGTKNAVLTGVSRKEGRLGVMSLCAETGEFYYYDNPLCEKMYHGTGDIYASTCVGALMNGMSLPEALSVAADYTVRCIELTMKDPDGRWYGVNFEEAVPYLIRRIGKEA